MKLNDFKFSAPKTVPIEYKLTLSSFQKMCDEHCEYKTKLEEAYKIIGKQQIRIAELEKLATVNENKTIVENDTPDASDTESGELKIETTTPKSAKILPKPESLIRSTVKNEPLNLSTPRGTKRERSDSAENDQTPVRKKSQTLENVPKMPFSCSGRFPKLQKDTLY